MDPTRSLVRAVQVVGCLALSVINGPSAVREEHFDREPPSWEGINHRNHFFAARTVTQDFGYSPASARAGGQPGEIGGRINPAGEPAYYGYRLPVPLDLNTTMTAEGRLYVAPGSGHVLVGFFNTNTLNEWRTPNTVVLRLNGRGETFHCHFEYCTSRWRAGAGVIGELVPGRSIKAREIPSHRPHRWKLLYAPDTSGEGGRLTLTLDDLTAVCDVPPEHRREGALVTHFGLVPVLKSWDSPGEVWIDDLTINGVGFTFSADPRWEAANNRRSYVSNNVRPKFDFGWSATHFAGGEKPGELGGLVFRGDCRETPRLASYGDRLETLTLQHPLEAQGKVAMLRGVSDSTASIGFYHSSWSLQTNSDQTQSVPRDYLGINVEGPSSEGFFFYPVYRTHRGNAGVNPRGAPRIHPDGKVHDWRLRYDPSAADGRGQITLQLDTQTCALDLAPGDKIDGTSFNRFGICTPWIDGNSVTVYFDDLIYTCAPP